MFVSGVNLNFARSLALQALVKPSKLSVKLYTANGFLNYTFVEAIDKLTNNSNFNIKARTMIYMHGFTGSPDSNNIKYIGQWITNKGWNLLSVDSTNYLDIIDYIKVAGLSTFIANIVGDFIYDLYQNGMPISNIYLVGHSLGAQMLGMASRRFRNKANVTIPRITGLDPASPCFPFPDKALNLNDADYVDITHTSILSYRDNTTAHAEFFVNNRKGKQPGCIVGDVACAHSRAISLFAESTKNYYGFIAKKCKNIDKYDCHIWDLSLMGFASKPKTRGVFFIKTNMQAPFAKSITGIL